MENVESSLPTYPTKCVVTTAAMVFENRKPYSCKPDIFELANEKVS